MAVDVEKKIKHGTATGTAGAATLPVSEPDEEGGEYEFVLIQNLGADVLFYRVDGADAETFTAGSQAVPAGQGVVEPMPAGLSVITDGTSCRYQLVGLTEVEAGQR